MDCGRGPWTVDTPGTIQPVIEPPQPSLLVTSVKDAIGSVLLFYKEPMIQ